MHRGLPKFNLEGDIHFITTKTHRNIPYFKDQECCKILLNNFNFYRERLKFKILGYVIMPDHFHCLIWLHSMENKATISDVAERIKSYAAREILVYLGKRIDRVNQSGRVKGPDLPEAVGFGQVEQGFGQVEQGFGQVGQGFCRVGQGPLTLPGDELIKKYPHQRMSDRKLRIWQDGFYDFNVLNEEKFLEKLNYMHDNPIKAELCQLPQEYLFSSARNYILEDLSVFRLDYL